MTIVNHGITWSTWTANGYNNKAQTATHMTSLKHLVKITGQTQPWLEYISMLDCILSCLTDINITQLFFSEVCNMHYVLNVCHVSRFLFII